MTDDPTEPKALEPEPDRRADAPHGLRGKELSVAPGPPVDDEPSPATTLGSQNPRIVERLELLDDTVFEAIAGKPGALERLRQLWPEVLRELGPDLLEESRSQYLRHAMSIWRSTIEGDEVRNPQVAIAVMDVICLLIDV
jgi:hypothetical protein